MSPDAIAFRNAVVALLTPLQISNKPAFAYIGRVPVEIEPDDNLPALIVIALREDLSADGDLNAGEPSFVARLALRLLIRLSANSREAADTRLQARSRIVVSTLLTDPALVSSIEGFDSVNEVRSFSKDGERFFAASQIDVAVQYRTSFPPLVPDDFREVSATAPLHGAGPKTPVITTKITLT